jgi:hypothetical protein
MVRAMEIFYRNERGGITRGIACWSYRTIPAVLIVPGVGPLSELTQVDPDEWFRREAIERAKPYTPAE